MLSTICFNLDQSNILSSGNGLDHLLVLLSYIHKFHVYAVTCNGHYVGPWNLIFQLKELETVCGFAL